MRAAILYVDGDWSSPDPVSVVRVAARNQKQLESGGRILSLANRTWHGIRHRMNRNTEEGSRRNIHAHYDLSNEFFRLFLDRNMVYSSALFIGMPNAFWLKRRRKKSWIACAAS